MTLIIGPRLPAVLPIGSQAGIYADQNQLRRELRFRFQLNISSRRQLLLDFLATNRPLLRS